jgi:chloramphenicol-sensitive protein RarD
VPESAPMNRDTRDGILFGVAAYGFWGIVAVYFKWVREVPPLEILAHRIVWSLAVLLAGVTLFRRWPLLAAVVRNRRTIRYLAVTTCVIAGNWFLFIWAVTSNHMVEASLGYFINPLVSVLLGALVLREQLRRWEWISVAIAAGGVLWLTLASGVFPWVSLVLALSFGLYGLLRKLAGVAAVEGLTVETALLAPLAASLLFYRAGEGTLAFGSRSLSLDLLLVLAGPVTALPLLWFAAAVRRLRLATVGLLQYISPSIQFTLAVLVYGEPMNRARLAAFAIIWGAIVLYTTENFRHHTTRAVIPPE